VATLIAVSYPSLQQDPNATTQSLLAQISQQLSNPTTNGSSPAASPSTQSSFSPSATVVFINSVWFLSLVLSLTCALIATLLQQWARRYRQIIQRNHAPHVRAHIREYFSRGARKFGIFGLVETLPLLLLVSVFLFFAGLVAFAFRANNTVAYITVAIVGLCFLSYIVLTLMPLIFHDCPYYTPFTSVLWFSAQRIPLSFFSVLYHGAEQLHDRWGTVSESMVESFRHRHKNKAKSLSEGMISKLENSAKRISMDIYKKTLIRTLHWLSEDHELEEFVAGIPGLCESDALTTGDNDDTQHTIRDVLATLPGPTSFNASLPWSIIQLAQRAFTRKLPKSVQQQRTRACLRALYHIPGAIRDVLAPYAAGKHYCLKILPLLNSQESLEVIDELWNTPNDDVALSVRCAAAVVAAFMITPSLPTTPNIFFIGDDNTGEQFMAERLRVDAGADGGTALEYHRGDSARLRNIMRFLVDIKDSLRYMNTQWWTSYNAQSIRGERRELFDLRHTEEYLTGRGTFDQQGDRASPAFVPAAQQDLIILTLEILTRDSVTNTTKPQREAFRDAWMQLLHVALTEPRAQARARALAQTQLPQHLVFENLSRIDVQAAESLEMVERALGASLGAVLQSLRQIVEIPTLDDDTSKDTSPTQMPVPQVVSAPAAAMVSTRDMPGSAHVGSSHRPPSPPIGATPIMLQYSSSAGFDPAAEGLEYSPISPV